MLAALSIHSTRNVLLPHSTSGVSRSQHIGLWAPNIDLISTSPVIFKFWLHARGLAIINAVLNHYFNNA